MTVYGYARVSTKKQSIDRQLTNIVRAYPEITERNLITEKETGTDIEVRAAFCGLLKRLRSGDTLVLDSVSRFSREAEEGFKLYQELYSKGVNLVFLKEPYINTDNYRAAMSVNLPAVSDNCLKPMMEGIEKTLLLLAQRQFKQAFEQAEKEVTDLSQRTKEGMKESGAGEKISKAKSGHTAKGVQDKQKAAVTKIRKHSKDFKGTLTDTEMQKLLDVSRNTYYKYKRLAKAGN